MLALLSVVGGVQALGPIGILTGPMVVVFLQTLLNLLHREISSMDGHDVAQESSASDEEDKPDGVTEDEPVSDGAQGELDQATV